MLYTRKGDGGQSGLFGTKDRFPKDSVVYEALGALDELNSLLGLCRSRAKGKKGEVDIAKELLTLQQTLFIAQAQWAGAPQQVTQAHVDGIEKTIADIEAVIVSPKSFVIPGTNELSASLDYARTVARRTERTVVRAALLREAPPEMRSFLNRLSSLLYALARYAAKGEHELSPDYH